MFIRATAILGRWERQHAKKLCFIKVLINQSSPICFSLLQHLLINERHTPSVCSFAILQFFFVCEITIVTYISAFKSNDSLTHCSVKQCTSQTHQITTRQALWGLLLSHDHSIVFLWSRQWLNKLLKNYIPITSLTIPITPNHFAHHFQSLFLRFTV